MADKSWERHTRPDGFSSSRVREVPVYLSRPAGGAPQVPSHQPSRWPEGAEL
jgi:hypothetical protein